MKTSKINTEMVEGAKMARNNNLCPRCKHRGVITPLTIDNSITIPVSIRWIFKITIGVKVEVKYCSTCGYFKLHISQDNVGTLLKIETPVEG